MTPSPQSQSLEQRAQRGGRLVRHRVDQLLRLLRRLPRRLLRLGGRALRLLLGARGRAAQGGLGLGGGPSSSGRSRLGSVCVCVRVGGWVARQLARSACTPACTGKKAQRQTMHGKLAAHAHRGWCRSP